MRGTDVLRAHHDEIRGLVRTLSQPTLPTADRKSVLDLLVTEMSLHEQIEDEIFYPAMHDISTLVTVSHAEHRELDDQVVVVVRVSDDSARFAEEFAALVAAFEHHAQLEENKMFPEAEAKVDDAALTDLGNRLALRLDRLRHSRITRMRMRLKLATLKRL